MKYFINTTYLEGKQDKTFLGIKYSETDPFLDLISIGIVSEEQQYQTGEAPNEKGIATMQLITKTIPSREYYSISKDFNLKQAWSNEWVRENVLKQVYTELCDKLYGFKSPVEFLNNKNTYTIFKELLNKYGKTNKQIAEEIKDLVLYSTKYNSFLGVNECKQDKDICFYSYNSSNDFEILNNLLSNIFPVKNKYYCLSLNQIYDKAQSYFKEKRWNSTIETHLTSCPDDTDKEHYEYAQKCFKDYKEYNLKYQPNYPKQPNKHNALVNAKWNYKLYKFLNTILNE